MLLREFRQGRGSRRACRGTAALEFGLAVPLLALLITAIVEIGFSMYQAMQVTYAAEAGLAYAAKKGWDSTGIANAATSSTGLSGMSSSPTQFCGCPSATGIATATCGTTCSSGDTVGQYIKISVSLTRTSIIGTTGFGLPSSFSAQSILRQN
jgi:Flp pilus assembly protein TadG